MAAGSEDVLAFWFGTAAVSEAGFAERMRAWFNPDRAFDADVSARFEPTVDAAARGELADWGATPRGRLALILLLDQFPRNIYRGTARAFALDPAALALATEGMAQGQDTRLDPIERAFFYLPLEHAEDRECQRRAVEAYRGLLDTAPGSAARLQGFYDYAVKHRDIIERFGRFPHRNTILGRESTPEEIDFLKDAERFGQGRA